MTAIPSPAKRVLSSRFAMLIAFFVTSADLVAQKIVGQEATVPAKGAPPQPFRLNHDQSKTYVFRDGDPKSEDAPQVVAVAGGGEIWLDDYYITARNLLLFTDASSSAVASRETKTGFPYEAEAPRLAYRQPQGVGGRAGQLSFSTTMGDLREIYAEGDVYITKGKNKIIQADKFYFNAIEDRSLIIGGEIRTDLSSVSLNEPKDAKRRTSLETGESPVPLVIRAAEIRGVSQGLYQANDASLTTSTFAKPGYHVAMDRVVYEERKSELGGRISGYNNRFILGDDELLQLDYLTVRAGVETPIPLIGLDLGLSGRFGPYIATRWGTVFQDAGDDFNRQIGVEGEFKGLVFADVNLYAGRGLGLGAGVQYATDGEDGKKYFGQTEFFLINDYSGDDETSPKDQESGWRGRFKSLNRSFLADDWQLDTEVYRLSDRGFLREFFEDEVDDEKVPETLAYLKKIYGDSAFTALTRLRINSWQTQTQYLPQVTYDVISRPVIEFDGFQDLLGSNEPIRGYWTHRTDIALVDRQHGDNGDSIEGTALRLDDIERFNVPFDLGNVGFDPYVEARLTGWGGDGQRDGDAAGRLGLTVGFNASTQYWKTDPDVESDFWNVHGMRHVVIPSLRYRWTFLSTEDSEDLIPYDNVERFDTLHAVVPGIDNRYQTKRMTRHGPDTVEFLRYEFQQPIVFQNGRDSDQRTLGPLHFEARYRPDLDRYLLRRSNFRTLLDYNWNDASLDTYRVEFNTEPGPDFFTRFAYSYADRGRVSPTLLFEGFTPESRRKRELNAFTVEMAYQATRIWEFAIVQQFDLSEESGGQSQLIVRRRSPDWMFQVTLGASAVGAGSGATFSISPVTSFEREERERFKTLLLDTGLTPIFDDPPYTLGPALGEKPGQGK